MTKLSIRTFNQDLEIRSEQPETGGKRITGYGIVYNRKTELAPGVFEVIRPGSARRFLETNPDIKVCLNHNTGFIFGRSKSGTANFEENQKGVKFSADPPDAQWARDAIASVERGDIDGASFAFRVNPESVRIIENRDGSILHEIHELDYIAEMGPVSDPAYRDTTAQYRNQSEEIEDIKTTAEALRTQGDEAANTDIRRTLEIEKLKLTLKEKELL